MKIFKIHAKIEEDHEECYLDVAHCRWEDDPDKFPIKDKFIWAWVNGELKVIKFWHPLLTSHQNYWEDEIRNKTLLYYGRFDADANIASIATPVGHAASYRPIPSFIEDALRNRFGKDIVIKRF